MENLKPFFSVISTMWKIQIVFYTLKKISQSAFHIVETISIFPQNYVTFLTVKLHIINHLERFFHIFSIEPLDLQGLSQILPQSAKFLAQYSISELWSLSQDICGVCFCAGVLSLLSLSIGSSLYCLIRHMS